MIVSFSIEVLINKESNANPKVLDVSIVHFLQLLSESICYITIITIIY